MSEKPYFIQSVLAACDAFRLTIAQASWDGTQLHLSGDLWSFNGIVEWRITCDGRATTGSADENAQARVSELIGLTVVAAQSQSSVDPYLDPVFTLSDGTRLEVFSSFSFEPWVPSLPPDKIIVA